MCDLRGVNQYAIKLIMMGEYKEDADFQLKVYEFLQKYGQFLYPEVHIVLTRLYRFV